MLQSHIVIHYRKKRNLILTQSELREDFTLLFDNHNSVLEL
jgi:hypothetical protein